jgi:hypothetical protein
MNIILALLIKIKSFLIRLNIVWIILQAAARGLVFFQGDKSGQQAARCRACETAGNLLVAI